MLRATCCAQHVARNMLLVAVNKIIARTSNMLRATSNLLPATCCSSTQLVAAQHVALVKMRLTVSLHYLAKLKTTLNKKTHFEVNHHSMFDRTGCSKLRRMSSNVCFFSNSCKKIISLLPEYFLHFQSFLSHLRV